MQQVWVGLCPEVLDQSVLSLLSLSLLCLPHLISYFLGIDWSIFWT